jgi:hypothetical protein
MCASNVLKKSKKKSKLPRPRQTDYKTKDPEESVDDPATIQ